MILFTANKDIASPFLEMETVKTEQYLHLPLENYHYRVADEESEQVKHHLEEIAFIIHGNLRNTRYFIRWMREHSQEEAVQNCVNLVLDQSTADFLEAEGIPVILPRPDAKPIDILEFMLRISKEGQTLYPTSEQKTEEMPGLLIELDMPVAEFSVCEEKPLDEKQLEMYRKQVASTQLKAVLLHNRSSYIRCKTAFPGLDFSGLDVIAGSKGVAELLRDEGIKPACQALGSWRSIAEVTGKL